MTNRRLDRLTILVIALTAVPLVVALIRAGQQHWYPTGDMAQAELHVRGFFRHPPLVGAAGRIGRIDVPYGQGSHPGPAMWVALLPTYVLLGRTAYGLLLGMTLLQGAFITASVYLARRVGGPTAGLAGATAVAVLVHSLGPATFLEPWNPWAALLAFFCFVVAMWGVLAGRSRWLIISVFSGVFAAQCHISYLPLVGVGLLVQVIVVMRRPRATSTTGIQWWWASVAVFVLMWVPPLLDQWHRQPGNLRILWRHFTSSTEYDGTPRAFVGLSQSAKTFAGELSIAGPWLRGQFRQPLDPPSLVLFLLTATIALAALARLWDSPRDESRRVALLLFGVVALLMSVGVLAMARIFGEFYGYVIRWWWILIAALLVAVVLALSRRPLGAKVMAVGCVTLALYASTAATVASAHEKVPSPRNSVLVGGITDAVQPRLDPHGRYLVRWYDPVSLGGVPYGVILELERRRFTVGVDAFASAGALPDRVMPEETATTVLWVVSGLTAINAFRARGEATELGYFDGRTAAEQIRSDELRTKLIGRLDEIGKTCLVPTIDTQYGLAPLVIGNAPVPPDVRVIAGDYNLLGLPVAVFALPTFSPGYSVDTPGCG